MSRPVIVAVRQLSSIQFIILITKNSRNICSRKLMLMSSQLHDVPVFSPHGAIICFSTTTFCSVQFLMVREHWLLLARSTVVVLRSLAMHWPCLSLNLYVHIFTVYLYPVLFIFICTANAVDVFVYHWQYALTSWCITLSPLIFLCVYTVTCKSCHRCFSLSNNRAHVGDKHVWNVQSAVCSGK